MTVTAPVGPVTSVGRVAVECGWCGQLGRQPVGRCSCGGALETRVRAAPAPAHLSGFYRDFWPVLPLDDQPLPELDLRTPVVAAPFLRRLVGGPEVYLKVESAQPTGSTKDRAAAVALPYLRQAG